MLTQTLQTPNEDVVTGNQCFGFEPVPEDANELEQGIYGEGPVLDGIKSDVPASGTYFEGETPEQTAAVDAIIATAVVPVVEPGPAPSKKAKKVKAVKNVEAKLTQLAPKSRSKPIVR